MSPSSGKGIIKRIRGVSLWDGPFLLLCLAVVLGVIATHAPETRVYLRAQNGLFVILLVTSCVFLLRGRLGFRHPIGLVRGWVPLADYWRSGLLGMDVYFLAVGLSVLLFLDFSIWRTAGVRIGTILGVVIVQVLGGAIWRSRANVGV
jgi:hypothetical protein